MVWSEGTTEKIPNDTTGDRSQAVRLGPRYNSLLVDKTSHLVDMEGLFKIINYFRVERKL
jgi:hypothetical protein